MFRLKTKQDFLSLKKGDLIKTFWKGEYNYTAIILKNDGQKLYYYFN